MTAPDRCAFGPDRRLTALAGAAARWSRSCCPCSSTDAPGRLLFAVAARRARRLRRRRPDLVAAAGRRPTGLRIRTPFTRADLAWPQVEDVRADVRSRYGLRSMTLEVDAGEVFVVFSRRSLGVDPEAARGLMAAMRPR